MRHFFAATLFALLLVAPSGAQETHQDTSAVEAAHAAWSAKANKKTRKALDKALAAYDGPPTTATVLAHLAVVKSDGAKGQASALRQSATSAANHLKPVKDQLPQQYLELRYMAAASQFNYRQKSDALIEMAHVEGESYQRKLSAEEGNESFQRLHNNARAWGMAMEAYFDSNNDDRPSDVEIESILKSYGADAETINARARSGETVHEETGEERLPFCPGGLKMKPKLKYPGKAANRGMVGAVILKFDQNADGKVINPRVLASVPDEGFKETALKTVSKWSYQPSNDETPGETCRLERKNLEFPIVFALD